MSLSQHSTVGRYAGRPGCHRSGAMAATSKGILAALVFLAVLSPRDAHAWKPKHHIFTGNEAIAEILAGVDSVTVDGRRYGVMPEIAQAVRNHPAAYRAGCIGPDGFPDLTFGQMIVHPDWKADGGTYTHEWLDHMYRVAWTYYNTHGGNADGQRALAFMYGFLTHAGGDLWGHTLINSFAGGSWPEIPDGDLSIAVRHIIVEEYISKRVPPTDMSIDVPTDFIYQMFVVNRTTYEMSRGASISGYFGIPYFVGLRDRLVATRSGLDCGWWPWQWFDCIEEAYINAWIADIDVGLQAWPGRMAEVGRHLFIDESERHMDGAKKDFQSFAYDHLLSMYGAPDFIGGILAGFDSITQWVESLLSINIPSVGDLVVYFIESAYGISFDELKEYFTHPVNYINQAPLFATNTSARLDLLIASNGTTFDSDQFAANANTITLGKMILLGPDELNRIQRDHGVGPLFGGANDAVPAGMRDNIMLGWIRSLDGDHQWRRTPYGDPGLRHSEGMTLWVDCPSRERVFRALFTDWEQHDPPANFPDDEDACECWNDQAPTITVAFNRDVIWPPNHKMAPITAQVTVTSGCDPSPQFALLAVTSDEPDDGHGDGHTHDDIQGADIGTPDTEFSLRAERMGGEDGRTYTVTYAAWDAEGNADTTSFAIRVPHDKCGTARVASGFRGDGAALCERSSPFILVIPSATDVPGDAMTCVKRIDPERCFVGDHKAQVAPISCRVGDVTDDGLDDLVLFFGSGALEATDHSGPDRRHIGLRYEERSGAGYLVPNIFDLGRPIKLPDSWVLPGDGVADVDPGAVPMATALVGIRPNPFNPSAEISFDLATPGSVRVAVYDLRGVLVRTLAETSLGVGRHEVTWDGRGMQGEPVASGVYFIRLQAPGVSQTMKAMLAK